MCIRDSSSTAYAGEEILRVLVPVVALAALEDLIPIAVVVCILLLVVISSYRQTIHALSLIHISEPTRPY